MEDNYEWDWEQEIEDREWTDADEAGLDQYEENRRRKIAEANEY